MAKRDTVNKNK